MTLKFIQEIIMLEKFSVTNFNKTLTFDFTASDYRFNPQSVKEGKKK
ncbi:hypothetical protein BHECKSOX2_873 [Bathymodiolus heckerae thiotrophic gill symbiont]|nr:hypothetical protein [uncultured Gammaproteobacteria bacterium]SMN13750.1 hypothetical protein BHECKSOX2_873 [Bathymodiolus heckerae thiotrophic gill symbiont]SMN15496.1 hypothetical protein CRYPD_538 [uncultured Candidatus Thioglobus sp.]